MKFFVTGASGFLGTHLVRQLTADGHEVVALVFESDRRGIVAGLGAEPVVGGLDDLELLTTASAGCDGVFHVAGYVSLEDPQGRLSRLVNVDGVESVLEAASRAGVRRVVHTSSLVTIGGNLDGMELDEESPWTLGDLDLAYVRTKREGEERALARNGDRLQVVVCNPPGMIGPQDLFGSEANVLFTHYQQGRLRVIPAVRNNWGDVRDVARGHIQAMQHGRAGQRYFLGGTNTTLLDLVERMDRLSARRPIRRWQLRWPITALIAQLLRPFSSQPVMTPGSARFMRYAFWISNARAMSELSYAPRPLDETLQETMEWFATGESAERAD